MLDRIEPAIPVVGVVVHGKARTGKSMILNQIARCVLLEAYGSIEGLEIDRLHPDVPAPVIGRCPSSGVPVPLAFGVGHGARPCTSGADGCFICLPAGAFGRSQPSVVLLIDCEGTGDKDAGYDAKVILPGLALCSGGVFIANMKNPPMSHAVLSTIENVLHAAAVVGRGRQAHPGDADKATLALVARDVQLEATKTLEDEEADLMRDEPEDPFAPAASDGAQKRNQARATIAATFKQCRVVRVPPPAGRQDAARAWPKKMDEALNAIDAAFERNVLPCLQDETPRCMLGMADVPLDTQHVLSAIEAIVDQANDATDKLRPSSILESIKEGAVNAVNDRLCAGIEAALVTVQSARLLDSTASTELAAHAVQAVQQTLIERAYFQMRKMYKAATRDDAVAVVRSADGPVQRQLRVLAASMESKARDRCAIITGNMQRMMHQVADEQRVDKMNKLNAKLNDVVCSLGREDHANFEGMLAGRQQQVQQLQQLQVDTSRIDASRELLTKMHGTCEQTLRESATDLVGYVGQSPDYSYGAAVRNATRQLEQLLISTEGADDAGAAMGDEAGGGAAGGGAAGGGVPDGIACQLHAGGQLLIASGLMRLDAAGAPVEPPASEMNKLVKHLTDDNDAIKQLCTTASAELEQYRSRLATEVQRAKDGVSEAIRLKDNAKELQASIEARRAEAQRFASDFAAKQKAAQERIQATEAAMQKATREHEEYVAATDREIERLRHITENASSGGGCLVL